MLRPNALLHTSAPWHSLSTPLSATTKPPPTLPSSIFALQETGTFWRSWLLLQSATRTVGIACFILSVAYLLCGWIPPYYEHADLRSYAMLSSHSWYAGSAFYFALAWNEKEHLELKQLEFQPVLEKAMPVDLDAFGRMVLVAAAVVDDVRGWCRVKGGQFEDVLTY